MAPRKAGASGWTESVATLFVMFTATSESPLDALVFNTFPRFFFLFFFRKLPASWLLDKQHDRQQLTKTSQQGCIHVYNQSINQYFLEFFSAPALQHGHRGSHPKCNQVVKRRVSSMSYFVASVKRMIVAVTLTLHVCMRMCLARSRSDAVNSHNKWNVVVVVGYKAKRC